jgi:hypothetical protein
MYSRGTVPVSRLSVNEFSPPRIAPRPERRKIVPRETWVPLAYAARKALAVLGRQP